jgi:hypothetical protein
MPVPASSVLAAPGGSITWTVDHAAKTITVSVRLEIYSGCGGNPVGSPADQAAACKGVASQVTQFLADKIRAQIESVWNKPYYYRCYRLIVQIDIKLGSDKASVDPDRIAVQIDPSPGDVRNFVESDSHSSNYNSDNPADKVDPSNNGAYDTTWSEGAQGSKSTYAHEFGHVIGLSDTYHDTTDSNGKTSSTPYPDAPTDLMSTYNATNIAPSTIQHLVRRNFPVMHDTAGNSVSDADLKCDVTLTIDNAQLRQKLPGGIGYQLYVTPEPDQPITLSVGDKGALTGKSPVMLDGKVDALVCSGEYHSTESIIITGTLTTTPDGKKRIATIKLTGPPLNGGASIKCPGLGGRSINFSSGDGFANRWATVIGSLTLTVGDPAANVSHDGSVGGVSTHAEGDFKVADASPQP